MPDLKLLIAVMHEARSQLADPRNDFAWSSWNDATDALADRFDQAMDAPD